MAELTNNKLTADNTTACSGQVCAHAGLKGSTALSQSVVTGGACAGFLYSSFKSHPEDRQQSLVDFDLALILTPMLLLGITAGMSMTLLIKEHCPRNLTTHYT